MKAGMVLMGFSFLLGSCALFQNRGTVIYSNGGPGIEGNGEIVTSERNVSSFENIQFDYTDVPPRSTVPIVRFHPGQEYRVIVATDSNIIKRLKITESKNTIKGGRYYNCTKFIVDIYCPAKMESIAIHGQGNIEFTDKITASMVEIAVLSFGTIAGEIECDTLSIDIAGNGEVDIEGSAKSTDISIAGNGGFTKSGFKTNDAHINIQGSGNVNIWAVDYLRVKIAGSGKIEYRGNPRLSVHSGDLSYTGGYIRKDTEDPDMGDI